MIAVENTVLVLLAAGRSRRFDGDKLCEPFLGRPLALHVVVALEALPFLERVAVVSDTRLDFAPCGYRMVHNPEPAQGLARSVARGVAVAKERGAAGVLIALADMPRVTATQICRLFDTAHGPDAIVASSDGVHPRPPALFGAAHFDTLLGLEGDRGAHELILRGQHVVTTPAELVDIDTRGELAALRALYGGETA
jgi:molybdenum cofactor cytidylyltransferase